MLTSLLDTQNPTIVCPYDQTHESEPGKPTAVVSWDAPATNDNANISPTVHCDTDSGGDFQIGQNRVKCTALDPSGNKATCSFTVFVEGKIIFSALVHICFKGKP